MNARTGVWHQRLARVLILNFIFGPLARLFLHTFFRLRVEGAAAVGKLQHHAIFACRHFYEWDPFLSFLTVCWPRSIAKPWLTPFNTAGTYWARNRFFRVLSWVCGNMVFIPGHEPDRGALGAVKKLMRTRSKFSVAVYPTGPIGRAKEYQLRYGIGWLARELPEIPIVPVSLIGVQRVTWSRVLMFRRPVIVVRIGAPLTAVGMGKEGRDLELAVLERLRGEWAQLEKRGLRSKARAR
jgi:1-acyl-sn-glycerol-3-phosphate acyltransferase